MHITSETDYAIRIVDCLARAGGRVGASSISEQTRVTLRFSLKILRKLVSTGIVRSYKGAQGGYELAKSADEITLGDVIEAIEGRYYLNRCLRDGHICTRVGEGELCPYHELFDDISKQVQKKLDSITMARMISEK